MTPLDLWSRGPQLTVVLHVLPPVPSTGQTRQALARSLRGQIGAVLGKDS